MEATPCKPEPAASFPTISRRRMTGTIASRDRRLRGQREASSSLCGLMEAVTCRRMNQTSLRMVPMTASPMPADQFWQIIKHAAKSTQDRDAHAKALRTALRKLNLEELISVAFRRNLNTAYTWDLCGAASVINCGCSDDGFEYFLRWLVSRGRDVYEAALADPDSLAELEVQPGVWGFWEFEEIYYVALEVFKEKGGKGDVRDYFEPEAGLGASEPSGEPLGEMTSI